MRLYIYKIFIILILGAYMQANSLKSESSSYLRAHSTNPVNWYAWNTTSLSKAKKENKLIFLSIGYSTCHWCHVMEEESFENKTLAKKLNKDYISIKIDREEMPDLDSYYQKIYQAFNGTGGGWPLSIIMTPDQVPIFAGTYIPLKAKYGQIGLQKLLDIFANQYKNNPKKIQESIKSIQKIQARLNPKLKSGKLHFEPIARFVSNVKSSYDTKHQGIGQAPKFPHASMLNTLLNIYQLKENNTSLTIAKGMLTKISHSGIHDLIEGGFYRYSVDIDFKIPHFEKMLYTNAELLSAYTKLYNITQNSYYKNIATDIVSQFRDNFFKHGLLYSASDADSKDSKGNLHEGYYHTYTYDEAYTALLKSGFSKSDIPSILAHFDITIDGNFENRLSNPHKTSTKTIQNEDQIISILKQLRQSKTYPFVDEKMQTSWNAMFITSLFDIDEQFAITLLENIIKDLYINDELYHYKVDGYKIKIKGYLEDYSFMIEALLKAYKYTLNKKYITLANTLYTKAKELFFDTQWYISQTQKINASSTDNAYKSAVAVMIQNILKLSLLNNDRKMHQEAVTMLSKLLDTVNRYPMSTPTLLDAILMQENLIIIKSNKQNLQNSPIKNIKYPYILIKSDENLDNFNICNHKICFANGDFDHIKKAIENEL